MMRSSTRMQTSMGIDPRRRSLIAGGAVYAGLLLVGAPASAFTVDQARSLIDRAISEVNAVISSGKPEAAMLNDFERIFSRYADVPTIARSSLGPVARQTNAADLAAYTEAFRGYITRKYGRRFREFLGGQIDVTGAKQLANHFEVNSLAKLRGQSPFAVDWHVSDRSGQPKFFNIIIEGVNMLAAERAEIGSILQAQKGSVAGLTAALRRI